VMRRVTASFTVVKGHGEWQHSMKSVRNDSKNKYGQYFTPAPVADFMIDLASISTDAKILEPSSGAGIFIQLLENRGFENVLGYEIDEEIGNGSEKVRHESFVTANVCQDYDLVIGNPPYIRWKNLEDELKKELEQSLLWKQHCNSLCDYLYIFIIKSIESLKEGGQLIFICPEYWMNTTNSEQLRNYMLKNGGFERIFHFKETPIFDGVTVSIVVFKYVKTQQRPSHIDVVKYEPNKRLTKELLRSLAVRETLPGAEYITVKQFEIGQRWALITEATRSIHSRVERACRLKDVDQGLQLFDDSVLFHRLGHFCDIGNGLVSGLDAAFRWSGSVDFDSGLINVVKAKDLRQFYTEHETKYIMLPQNLSEDQVQSAYPDFHRHLSGYRDQLEKRYQYKRRIPFYEWVFLRNFKLFSKCEPRILVPCKERISSKSYFRFALAGADVFPTQDVTAILRKPATRESIEYIVAYLNSSDVFEWLRWNGIVKGNIVEFSETPLASIPFLAIDWENDFEVSLHDEITDLVSQFDRNRSDLCANLIESKIKMIIRSRECL
jgi:adenine-specific DNA-methyltransferase